MEEEFNDIFTGYENDLQKAVALVEWQKSEIKSLKIYLNTFSLALKNLEKERHQVASEIFEEIEKILHCHGITIGLVFDEGNGADVAIGRIEKMIAELKKKYTEDK